MFKTCMLQLYFFDNTSILKTRIEFSRSTSKGVTNKTGYLTGSGKPDLSFTTTAFMCQRVEQFSISAALFIIGQCIIRKPIRVFTAAAQLDVIGLIDVIFANIDIKTLPVKKIVVIIGI